MSQQRAVFVRYTMRSLFTLALVLPILVTAATLPQPPASAAPADFSNTPPAHALARRGVVDNVRGYMLYGDYAEDDPPRAIVDDVARSQLDVAVVWGPLAGYAARRHGKALRLRPVSPLTDGPMLPMVFDISMGVRKEDRALRRELDQVLSKRAAEIRTLLESYGVPIIQPVSR